MSNREFIVVSSNLVVLFSKRQSMKLRRVTQSRGVTLE
jgi:hypothetical protein